jgi:hypothetical protein
VAIVGLHRVQRNNREDIIPHDREEIHSERRATSQSTKEEDCTFCRTPGHRRCGDSRHLTNDCSNWSVTTAYIAFLSPLLRLLSSVDYVTDPPLPTGFPVLIILLIPLRWFWMPKWFNRRDLQITDDLTANNEAVLASLGGAPTMPERGDLREKESQRRYRSEDWGRERRYSESKGGVKRQRAGSHHRS